MTEKCNHVTRIPLHESIRVGGFGGMGACTNNALPGMVVCAEHATPDAIRIQMEYLKRGRDFLVSQLREIMENWNGEESIEAIRFLLDMDPLEDEWLPDPAPPGTFDEKAPATPLEEVLKDD